MTGMAAVLRSHRAPRATSVRRLVLSVILAGAAVLGDAPAGGAADGPLTFEASVSVGSRAHDIVLDGAFAYVATHRGLTILDISDPDPMKPPVLRGSVVTANCAVDCARGPVARSQGLAKKGNFIYLAAGLAGMQVINVADPDHPMTIASAIAHGAPLFRPAGATGAAPARGSIYHIAVHPTAPAAYAASYNGEVYVWDISNPAAPVLTQTLGVMLWGGGVCTTCVERMLDHVENGTAYVTGVTAVGNRVVAVDWGYAGFYVWDSTDPLKLEFLGTHRLKVSMYRVAVDLARDVVYTLGAVWINSGLITTPLSPVVAEGGATYCSSLGGLPTPAPASTAPKCGVTETCFPCGHARMTTPTGSALVGDGGGIGFSSNGPYAFYVGGRGNGELAIIDVTDPYEVVKVASIPVGPMNLQLAEGAGIVARNDLLYIAAGPLGVRVYKYPGLGSSGP